MLRQGVTTLVVGNCGFSAFPITDRNWELIRDYTSFFGPALQREWDTPTSFLKSLSSLELRCNIAVLIGHGTVRAAVMGFEDRRATDAEIESMAKHVELALSSGVFGMSSGLVYPPGCYADRRELNALCSLVAKYGAFYATHVRNESDGAVEAIDEAIETARATNVKLQLSHHKVTGKNNHGKVQDTLAQIDSALTDGMDVLADAYPYPATSTTLSAVLPKWAMDGGVTSMRDRLADPRSRERIRTEILLADNHERSTTRPFDAEAIIVGSVARPNHKRFEGSSLAEIAHVEHRAPVDVALDLLADEGGAVQMVVFSLAEDDVRAVLRHPAVAVASDGWTLHPDEGGLPHPRSYGTFAKVIRQYVVQERLLSLEEAVHKMTGLPARRLGVPDRGTIRPGNAADIVTFRPEAVTDRATFKMPHQFATGIDDVMVNGVLAIDRGEISDDVSGHVLRFA
jgi:N-acyl-D-amino-acid deacylase